MSASPDRNQLVRRQLGGQVEEGLRTGSEGQPAIPDDVGLGEPAGVHHQLGALGEHPPRDQDDVRSSRRVEVRAEQRGCRAVTERGVRWHDGGQHREPLHLVDRVVHPDVQVVGQPEEPGAPEPGAGQPGGASGGGGVGRREGHPADRGAPRPVRRTRDPICGGPPPLWTPPETAVIIGGWLPDTSTGTATRR